MTPDTEGGWMDRPVRWHGRPFEDFTVGRVFEHHWGRTVLEADAMSFSTLTLSYNPLYFNREFARARGHADLVVNPMLVLLTAIGLSVEDLSEGGVLPSRSADGDGIRPALAAGGSLPGGFLGIDDLSFHCPVYPGDTLRAQSEVLVARRSRSRPGAGIVTWHTRCFNQRDTLVLDLKRSNMLPVVDVSAKDVVIAS